MSTETVDEIVIARSRGKTILGLLGCLVFVAIGITFWSIADAQSRMPPRAMKGIGVLASVFFGACGVYGCISLFDSRPGLIIDSEGFTDRSTAAAAGRVLWRDVVGIGVCTVNDAKFLAIEVVNPAAYRRRANPFKRAMMHLNHKMMDTPITISSTVLQIQFEDLRRLMIETYEEYAGQSHPGSRRHNTPGKPGG